MDHLLGFPSESVRSDGRWQEQDSRAIQLLGVQEQLMQYVASNTQKQNIWRVYEEFGSRSVLSSAYSRYIKNYSCLCSALGYSMHMSRKKANTGWRMFTTEPIHCQLSHQFSVSSNIFRINRGNFCRILGMETIRTLIRLGSLQFFDNHW